MGSVILALVFVVVGQLVYTNRRGRSRELLLASANHQLGVANADLARTNAELRDAMTEVRALTGLIPICSHCRQVRDDQGYWQAVETYVANHSSATFSHSICQSCGPELFGEYWTDAESERDASTGSEPGAAAQTEAPGK